LVSSGFSSSSFLEDEPPPLFEPAQDAAKTSRAQKANLFKNFMDFLFFGPEGTVKPPPANS
jgi:hypothetical protein